MTSATLDRLSGHVRNYCPIRGYGYIKCKGAGPGGTDRDVFLDRDTLLAEKLEVTNGAYVTFSLKDGENFRPEACGVKVLMEGVRQREFVSDLAGTDVDWTKTYQGKIMYYGSDTKFLPASFQKRDAGCGWIACEETRKMFGRDMWAYPSQLEGFNIGDVVKFRVKIDHWWSWPTAVDIRPVDSTPLKDEDIPRLLQEREQCRRMRNFRRADDIADMLRDFGVSLEGRAKKVMQEDEIQRLLKEREQCRRVRDFRRADEIRDMLRGAGVNADNWVGRAREAANAEPSLQTLPTPSRAGGDKAGESADSPRLEQELTPAEESGESGRWTKYIDPESKQPWLYNEETGESKWLE